MKYIETISEFHQFRQLPAPQHPLISVIDVGNVTQLHEEEPSALSFGFYNIALKRIQNAKIRYGQHPFDFNEGALSFMAPKQVFSIALNNEKRELKQSGWVLCLHPDFLWNTALAKTIRHYDFWSYSLHEALFLSQKEEDVINQFVRNIQQECQSNIDKFTKKIIVAQIESLLQYADRFYHRQFITREKANHQLLEQFDQLLLEYFASDDLMERGLPTVQFMAEKLHLSPKYLSSLLRVLTGQNAQQHIHHKLIETAKEKLSTTTLTVSEIAYALGFEHLTSFSKLFKAKTNLSPLAFRNSFN